MRCHVLSCRSPVPLLAALILSSACIDIPSPGIREGDLPLRITAPQDSSSVALAPVPVPTPEGPAYARGIIRNVAVVYQNGDEHAENVELHLLHSKEMLLAFRAGGTGQAETGTARIRVFHFDPLTYAGRLASEVVPPASDPVRGIRDPKLFEWNGALKLGAISRVSGFPIRDLLADTRTVVATSHDDGESFDTPVPVSFRLTEKPWGLWRYVSWKSPLGAHVLYATGYDDGDQEAAYFASLDGGKSFAKLGSLMNAPGLVPSEAELNFVGKDGNIAVSLVRLDNQGLLEDGQTAVCVKRGSWFGFYGDFDCSRRLEQRLDGPSRVFEVDGRHFVVARKHLACTRKRTALYELRGDLADPGSPLELFEVADLPSNGDTAYAAVAPIPGRPRQFALAWYSTPLGADLPWLPAQFGPTWILAATLDFSHYDPSIAVPAGPDAHCPAGALPDGRAADVEGPFLLSVGPSFFPDLPAVFVAQASTAGGTLTLALQAVDQNALIGTGSVVPVGDPFQGSGSVDANGHFSIDFGNPVIPFAAYPLGTAGDGGAGITFELREFRIDGVTTSGDSLCGNVSGDVLVRGEGLIPPNTRLLFEGSTFGADRQQVVTACQ
jgi:hypothetical protein